MPSSFQCAMKSLTKPFSISRSTRYARMRSNRSPGLRRGPLVLGTSLLLVGCGDDGCPHVCFPGAAPSRHLDGTVVAITLLIVQ